ncbi:hypothetical protein CR513_26552, partial [Mucuna pruriens]
MGVVMILDSHNMIKLELASYPSLTQTPRSKQSHWSTSTSTSSTRSPTSLTSHSNFSTTPSIAPPSLEALLSPLSLIRTSPSLLPNSFVTCSGMNSTLTTTPSPPLPSFVPPSSRSNSPISPSLKNVQHSHINKMLHRIVVSWSMMMGLDDKAFEVVEVYMRELWWLSTGGVSLNLKIKDFEWFGTKKRIIRSLSELRLSKGQTLREELKVTLRSGKQLYDHVFNQESEGEEEVETEMETLPMDKKEKYGVVEKEKVSLMDILANRRKLDKHETITPVQTKLPLKLRDLNWEALRVQAREILAFSSINKLMTSLPNEIFGLGREKHANSGVIIF